MAAVGDKKQASEASEMYHHTDKRGRTSLAKQSLGLKKTMISLYVKNSLKNKNVACFPRLIIENPVKKAR